MNKALLQNSAVIASVLLFILAPHAFAKTTIDISNNGEGSKTNVEVKQSTGGTSYTSSNTSNISTDIEVNSNGTRVETHDETGTQVISEPASQNTSVKVYQTGDAKPTIIIEKGSATIQSDSDNDEKSGETADDTHFVFENEQSDEKQTPESLISKIFNIQVINTHVAEDLKSGNVFLATIHLFTETKFE